MKRLLPLVLIAAACTTAVPAPSATPAGAAPTSQPASAAPASLRDGWADDLATLDNTVRRYHPDPFAIHSEEEWDQLLAEFSSPPPRMTLGEQTWMIASLVGLLDTHSALIGIPDGWHYYGVLPYRFEDGWYVVNATDESLIGQRVLQIGAYPIEGVEARLTPLVPHDNESGLLENMMWAINSVEFLTAADIVSDAAHAGFVLESADGTTQSVDPPVLSESEYDLAPVGWLSGEAPEAVARRGEQIWTRLDEESETFLISVNDYGDMSAATTELTQALDDGLADRVVVDMRYLRGGNADFPLLDVLTTDDRINRPGGLIVLIGRENVSAATLVAHAFDTDTDSVLVGEATPARADNFLCSCFDIRLPYTGYLVSVPTQIAGNGDARPAIAPDVPMGLLAEDFFAGRDPVLDAALDGIEP